MDYSKGKLIDKPLQKHTSYEEQVKNASTGNGKFEDGSLDIKTTINRS